MCVDILPTLVSPLMAEAISYSSPCSRWLYDMVYTKAQYYMSHWFSLLPWLTHTISLYKQLEFIPETGTLLPVMGQF